ncbi:MAG: hypothetical protein DRN26_03300, partial [Thermoplasmata archaeon]
EYFEKARELRKELEQLRAEARKTSEEEIPEDIEMIEPEIKTEINPDEIIEKLLKDGYVTL